MCAIEIERIKSKLSSSTAQTPPPSSGSSNPSSQTPYFEHHQQNQSHPQPHHLRSLQQPNVPLYQSAKVEESGVSPEILFPPWPSANYHSYYDTGSGPVSLPEITAISVSNKATEPEQQQQHQRFAKLAELAGETETAPAVESFENGRYGETSPRLRTGSEDAGNGEEPLLHLTTAMQANAMQQQQQHQQRQQVAETLTTNTTHLYDSSSNAVTISTYEQAAVSSLKLIVPIIYSRTIFRKTS